MSDPLNHSPDVPSSGLPATPIIPVPLPRRDTQAFDATSLPLPPSPHPHHQSQPRAAPPPPLISTSSSNPSVNVNTTSDSTTSSDNNLGGIVGQAMLSPPPHDTTGGTFAPLIAPSPLLPHPAGSGGGSHFGGHGPAAHSRHSTRHSDPHRRAHSNSGDNGPERDSPSPNLAVGGGAASGAASSSASPLPSTAARPPSPMGSTGDRSLPSSHHRRGGVGADSADDAKGESLSSTVSATAALQNTLFSVSLASFEFDLVALNSSPTFRRFVITNHYKPPPPLPPAEQQHQQGSTQPATVRVALSSTVQSLRFQLANENISEGGDVVTNIASFDAMELISFVDIPAGESVRVLAAFVADPAAINIQGTTTAISGNVRLTGTVLQPPPPLLTSAAAAAGIAAVSLTTAASSAKSLAAASVVEAVLLLPFTVRVGVSLMDVQPAELLAVLPERGGDHRELSIANRSPIPLLYVVRLQRTIKNIRLKLHHVHAPGTDVLGCRLTLPPHETCKLILQMESDGAPPGTYTFVLQCDNMRDARNQLLIPATVNVTSLQTVELVSVSHEKIDFGNLYMGGTAEQEVTVRNVYSRDRPVSVRLQRPSRELCCGDVTALRLPERTELSDVLLAPGASISVLLRYVSSCSLAVGVGAGDGQAHQEDVRVKFSIDICATVAAASSANTGGGIATIGGGTNNNGPSSSQGSSNAGGAGNGSSNGNSATGGAGGSSAANTNANQPPPAHSGSSSSLAAVTGHRTIFAKAHLYASTIAVPSTTVKFGDCIVSQSKRAQFVVENRSPLPGAVLIRLHSKVIAVDNDSAAQAPDATTMLMAAAAAAASSPTTAGGSSSSSHSSYRTHLIAVPAYGRQVIKLCITPQRVNPDYKKQLTVVNVNDPSQEHIVNIEANNMAPEETRQHDALYSCEPLLHYSQPRIVCRVPFVVPYAFTNKSATEGLTLGIQSTSPDICVHLPHATATAPPGSSLASSPLFAAAPAPIGSVLSTSPTPGAVEEFEAALLLLAAIHQAADSSKGMAETPIAASEGSGYLPPNIGREQLPVIVQSVEQFLSNQTGLIEAVSLAPLERRVVYVVVRRTAQCPAWASKEDCISVTAPTVDLPRILRLSYRLCETRLDVGQRSRSFGDVDLGERRTLKITIRNASESVLWFQVTKHTSITTMRIANTVMKAAYTDVIKALGSKDIEISVAFGLRGSFRETLTICNLLDVSNSVQLTLKADVRKVDPFEVNPEAIAVDLTVPPFISPSSNQLSSATFIGGSSVPGAIGGGGSVPAGPSIGKAKITVTNTSKSRKDLCVTLLQPLDKLLNFDPSVAAELTLDMDEAGQRGTATTSIAERIEALDQKLKIAIRKGKKEKETTIKKQLEKLRVALSGGTLGPDADENDDAAMSEDDAGAGGEGGAGGAGGAAPQSRNQVTIPNKTLLTLLREGVPLPSLAPMEQVSLTLTLTLRAVAPPVSLAVGAALTTLEPGISPPSLTDAAAPSGVWTRVGTLQFSEARDAETHKRIPFTVTLSLSSAAAAAAMAAVAALPHVSSDPAMSGSELVHLGTSSPDAALGGGGFGVSNSSSSQLFQSIGPPTKDIVVVPAQLPLQLPCLRIVKISHNVASFLDLPVIKLGNTCVNEKITVSLTLSSDMDTVAMFAGCLRCGGNLTSTVNPHFRMEPPNASLRCNVDTTFHLHVTPRTPGPQRYFAQIKNIQNASDVIVAAIDMNPLPAAAIAVDVEGSTIDFGQFIVPLKPAPLTPTSTTTSAGIGGGGAGSLLAGAQSGGFSGGGSGSLGTTGKTLVIRNCTASRQHVLVYCNRPSHVMLFREGRDGKRALEPVGPQSMILEGGGSLRLFAFFNPICPPDAPPMQSTRLITAGIIVEAIEFQEQSPGIASPQPAAVQQRSVGGLSPAPAGAGNITAQACVSQSILVKTVAKIASGLIALDGERVRNLGNVRVWLQNAKPAPESKNPMERSSSLGSASTTTAPTVTDKTSASSSSSASSTAMGGLVTTQITVVNKGTGIPITFKVELTSGLSLEPFGTTNTQTIQPGGEKRLTIAVKQFNVRTGPLREMVTIVNLTAGQEPLQVPVTGFKTDGTFHVAQYSVAMPRAPVYLSTEHGMVVLSAPVQCAIPLTNTTGKVYALVAKVPDLPISISADQEAAPESHATGGTLRIGPKATKMVQCTLFKVPDFTIAERATLAATGVVERSTMIEFQVAGVVSMPQTSTSALAQQQQQIGRSLAAVRITASFAISEGVVVTKKIEAGRFGTETANNQRVLVRVRNASAVMPLQLSIQTFNSMLRFAPNAVIEPAQEAAIEGTLNFTNQKQGPFAQTVLLINQNNPENELSALVTGRYVSSPWRLLHNDREVSVTTNAVREAIYLPAFSLDVTGCEALLAESRLSMGSWEGGVVARIQAVVCQRLDSAVKVQLVHHDASELDNSKLPFKDDTTTYALRLRCSVDLSVPNWLGKIAGAFFGKRVKFNANPVSLEDELAELAKVRTAPSLRSYVASLHLSNDLTREEDVQLYASLNPITTFRVDGPHVQQIRQPSQTANSAVGGSSGASGAAAFSSIDAPPQSRALLHLVKTDRHEATYMDTMRVTNSCPHHTVRAVITPITTHANKSAVASIECSPQTVEIEPGASATVTLTVTAAIGTESTVEATMAVVVSDEAAPGSFEVLRIAAIPYVPLDAFDKATSRREGSAAGAAPSHGGDGRHTPDGMHTAGSSLPPSRLTMLELKGCAPVQGEANAYFLQTSLQQGAVTRAVPRPTSHIEFSVHCPLSFFHKEDVKYSVTIAAHYPQPWLTIASAPSGSNTISNDIRPNDTQTVTLVAHTAEPGSFEAYIIVTNLMDPQEMFFLRVVADVFAASTGPHSAGVQHLYQLHCPTRGGGKMAALQGNVVSLGLRTFVAPFRIESKYFEIQNLSTLPLEFVVKTPTSYVVRPPELAGAVRASLSLSTAVPGGTILVDPKGKRVIGLVISAESLALEPGAKVELEFDISVWCKVVRDTPSVVRVVLRVIPPSFHVEPSEIVAAAGAGWEAPRQLLLKNLSTNPCLYTVEGDLNAFHSSYPHISADSYGVTTVSVDLQREIAMHLASPTSSHHSETLGPASFGGDVIGAAASTAARNNGLSAYALALAAANDSALHNGESHVLIEERVFIYRTAEPRERQMVRLKLQLPVVPNNVAGAAASSTDAEAGTGARGRAQAGSANPAAGGLSSSGGGGNVIVFREAIGAVGSMVFFSPARLQLRVRQLVQRIVSTFLLHESLLMDALRRLVDDDENFQTNLSITSGVSGPPMARQASFSTSVTVADAAGGSSPVPALDSHVLEEQHHRRPLSATNPNPPASQSSPTVGGGGSAAAGALPPPPATAPHAATRSHQTSQHQHQQQQPLPGGTFSLEHRVMIELCCVTDELMYLVHHRDLRASPHSALLQRLWITLVQLLVSSVANTNVMRAFVERRLWENSRAPAPILKQFAVCIEKLREVLVHCERSLSHHTSHGGGGSGGGGGGTVNTSSTAVTTAAVTATPTTVAAPMPGATAMASAATVTAAVPAGSTTPTPLQRVPSQLHKTPPIGSAASAGTTGSR